MTVLNLDTGEQIPLSIAEDKLPQCLNPLSLHIMRLTSEYIRYLIKTKPLFSLLNFSVENVGRKKQMLALNYF